MDAGCAARWTDVEGDVDTLLYNRGGTPARLPPERAITIPSEAVRIPSKAVRILSKAVRRYSEDGEKGRRMNVHGRITEHFMGGFILHPFAGPPGGRSLPFLREFLRLLL